MVGRSAEVRPARVDRVLGSRLFVAGSMRSTGSRLRILAFHGVGDVVAFGRQLDVVAETSNPVSSGDVCDWLGGRGELPRRAVWITFDDGEPSAVVDAAPALAARGIRATVFVCPAFVGGLVRPWWQVVDDALAAGLAIPDGLGVASLKALGDDRRRSVVASLAVALDSVDADRRPAGRRVLNLDDLRGCSRIRTGRRPPPRPSTWRRRGMPLRCCSITGWSRAGPIRSGSRGCASTRAHPMPAPARSWAADTARCWQRVAG